MLVSGLSRRSFLQRSAGLAAGAPGRAAAAPPNILLILADDLGYGDLGAWGARDIQTPNIDALAASGVRFDPFYSNSPVCSPTRAALLTGRYPDCVGVPGVIRTHAENSWGYLAPDAELLPARLRRAGYHTAAIGKWHLGLESPNTPTERGFDFFHGFLGDMMDDYYTHRRHGNNYMRRDRAEIDPHGHATDLFTAWAAEYLKSRASGSAPFFLYLAYNAPHTPIQPPEDWFLKVMEREKGIAQNRARLAALIEHMDHSIGRVIDALKANGQYENTLIVFTSDNGGELGVGGSCGGLRGGKGDMYEGGIRVPLCAVWRNRIAPGSRGAQTGLACDLFPTVCEAAGAPVPSGLDGRSLLGAMLGKPPAAAGRDLVWVRREGGLTYQGREYYALRRGDWKLLQNSPFERYQLFHLREDPKETRDLSTQEPKIFRKLSAALMRHVQRAGRVPWQRP